MKTTLAILTAVGMASVASAQTFPADAGTVPAVIPDNTGATGGGVDITFSVSGTSIGDSLESVSLTFDPAHTWVGDLVAVLTAPGGQDVQVLRRAGSASTIGSGSNFVAGEAYVFAVSGADFNAALTGNPATVASGVYAQSTTSGLAATPVADADGYSVFTGDLNGIWTLRISDWASGDTGSVSAASITIVPAPGALALLGLGGLAAARRRRA